MNYKELFINSLKNFDLDGVKKVPKADLHNHTYLGGSREYLFKKTGKNIPVLDKKLGSMDEMHHWVNQNVKQVLEDKQGRILAVEACFFQALQDGVTVLEIGEDVWANEHFYNGDIDKFIDIFLTAKNTVNPGVDFRFQIGLSRHCPIELIEEWIAPFWERDVFYSLDLYGDELSQPIKNFKRIYRKAKEKGLVLKAHVGEWGNADSVFEAVEELELDEVQHGISAADSPKVMNWLVDHNIQLNICPTSNVMLNRVESLSTHPVRVLYDNGIKLTVNTDDVLVFNQSVSDEFMNLYKVGLFNANELNCIRENGLNK